MKQCHIIILFFPQNLSTFIQQQPTTVSHRSRRQLPCSTSFSSTFFKLQHLQTLQLLPLSDHAAPLTPCLMSHHCSTVGHHERTYTDLHRAPASSLHSCRKGLWQRLFLIFCTSSLTEAYWDEAKRGMLLASVLNQRHRAPFYLSSKAHEAIQLHLFASVRAYPKPYVPLILNL